METRKLNTCEDREGEDTPGKDIRAGEVITQEGNLTGRGVPKEKRQERPQAWQP